MNYVCLWRLLWVYIEARTFFLFLEFQCFHFWAFLKRRSFLLTLPREPASFMLLHHSSCLCSLSRKIKRRSLKWFPCKINASLDFCQMLWYIYVVNARKFRTCIWKELKIVRQKAFVAWGNVMTPPVSFSCLLGVFVVCLERPWQVLLLF